MKIFTNAFVIVGLLGIIAIIDVILTWIKSI